MKVSKYISHKISVLNFFAIILVVYIHSYYLEAENYPLASAVQSFVGSGVGGASIAMFFTFSGFFFFRLGIGNVDCCGNIRKRIKTILVPYILWNIIFVLWYVFLGIIPGIRAYVNSNLISDIFSQGITFAFCKLFITPAGFHLWFLRDLFLLVLISPLLYKICKTIKWLAPISFCLIEVLIMVNWGDWFEELGFSLHNANGLTFFTFGACIALFSNIEKISERGNWIFRFCCATLFLLYCVVQSLHIMIPPGVSHIAAFSGIVVIWHLYDWIACREMTAGIRISKVLPYSFFVYLFHEPTFNIIKKIGLKLLGVHEWSLILLYLINPIIMCALAIAVAKVLQKYTPKMYGILVGGR